jgi:glycosidase
MQWNGGPNAGFTTSESPWMPMNDNYLTANVLLQSTDPDSILAFWKEMLQTREVL